MDFTVSIFMKLTTNKLFCWRVWYRIL